MYLSLSIYIYIYIHTYISIHTCLYVVCCYLMLYSLGVLDAPVVDVADGGLALREERDGGL